MIFFEYRFHKLKEVENMYDFTEIKKYMDYLHTERGVPCNDVIIYKDGLPVYRYMTGKMNASQPVNNKTLYDLYSCSKPITVTAAMQLIEKGKLSLEDKVSKYLPEYKNAFIEENGDKVVVGDSMTVRHLLTMSAGLDYNRDNHPAILEMRKDRYDVATTRDVVSLFIKDYPLSFRPGERFQYSLCHDVLGAIIEIVSGESLGEYFKNHIFEPLGMKNIGFNRDNISKEAFADKFIIDNNTKDVLPEKKGIDSFQISKKFESGGAGLFASTEDYGKFAAAMSLGGVSADGVRILKSETVDLMRTPQMGSYVMNNKFSCAAGAGYSYGLGVRTMVDNSQGQKSSIGEFGWDGAAGAYILMDPAKKVAIVYTQHILNWPARFGEMHNPIRDAAYTALGF